MSPNRMPAFFIGHGSPRITFQHNEITDAWRALAASVPRPQAIVVISAHWFINASAVTAMVRPRTVHDFFYGPAELYAFEYPAPGEPALVEHMIDLVRPTWLGPDVDSWGLDHGCWSVLAHMYPDADIPVVQLALNASMPLQYHLELGALLDPFRDEGILIIGSGNIVHNGHVTSEEGRAAGELARAEEFDRAVSATMTTVPGEAAKLGDHTSYDLAAPTPDHFLPLLYLAGIAATSGEASTVVIDGPELGRIGMTSYRVGATA